MDASKKKKRVSVTAESITRLSAESEQVANDIDRLIFEVTEAAAKLLKADRATLFLFDDVGNVLWSKAAVGTQHIFTVKPGQGLSGSCIELVSIVNVPDAYADARFSSAFDKKVRAAFVHTGTNKLRWCREALTACLVPNTPPDSRTPNRLAM